MPGSGTDHTREWSAFGGPVIVLVEPELGENIGTAARAMANFGLTRLRLVNPRDGWPNVHARRAASGADPCSTAPALRHAAGDDCRLQLRLATTARAHDQAKPVIGPRTPQRRWRRASRAARPSPSCSAASAGG